MKYLFIDHHHIQRLDGIERRVHQPVKDTGPVLAPERPWEGSQLHIWNAPAWCPERNRWRMWYIGGEELLPLYAESGDGRNWERPMLDRVDWNGSTANNIIQLGFRARTPKERRLVLVRDDRDPDPARRYKALTRFFGPPFAHLTALVSPDGLDWTPIENTPIPSDDEYRLGYDTANRRFFATVKSMAIVPEFGRTVCLSLSDDFVHWTQPEMIFWGDETDQAVGRERVEAFLRDPDRRRPLANDPSQYHTDVYYMPAVTYEGLYVGFPAMFNQTGLLWYPDPKTAGFSANQDGFVSPGLAVSRNLRDWEHCRRCDVIPPSLLTDPDNYDFGSVYPTPPVVAGDELWFYYYGARFTHVRKELLDTSPLRASPDEPTHAIFRARLRRDGFASLSAGAEPGAILTRSVRVDGPELFLNLAAAQGEVRVELRDAETGRVIPGYGMGNAFREPWHTAEDGRSRHRRMGTGARRADDCHDDDSVPIQTDGVTVPVHWKRHADVAALQGRDIRLSFYLRNADLFAFGFDRIQDGAAHPP